MKSKKRFMVFALILIVFSFAGCGRSPGTTAPIEVHVGVEGLKMSFMERSPPGEVYVGDRFPLSIELQNRGAYDIDKGIIAIGAEADYISVPAEYSENPVSFSILGRSMYDPVGGIDRKTISLTARYLEPQSETHATTLALTACYPYRTEAAAQVCIDTDIYNQRLAEKVCTPSVLSMGTVQKDGQELPKGQGAPIAITKIEQKMAMHPESDEFVVPRFFIYVRNMGAGLPIDIEKYDKACSATGIDSRAWNIISARAYLSDRSVQLDCTPKFDSSSSDRAGHLRLEKNEDFISCSLPEGIPISAGTYTTPLMIDLDYGYTFTISKNVLIKRQV